MSSLHSNSISVWSIVFYNDEQTANMNLTHNILRSVPSPKEPVHILSSQRRLSCGSCNCHALSVNLVLSQPLVRFRWLFCSFGDSRALSATLVRSGRFVQFWWLSCGFGDRRVLPATSCTHGESPTLLGTRVRSRRARICSNFETDGSSNSLSFSLKHLCTFGESRALSATLVRLLKSLNLLEFSC